MYNIMHETKEKGTQKELSNGDSFFVADKAWINLQLINTILMKPLIVFTPSFYKTFFSLTLAHRFIKLECYFGLNFQAGKMVPSKAWVSPSGMLRTVQCFLCQIRNLEWVYYSDIELPTLTTTVKHLYFKKSCSGQTRQLILALIPVLRCPPCRHIAPMALSCRRTLCTRGRTRSQ